MNDFREITITDKDLFDRYIREYPPGTSEINFTNIFMWRKTYKYLFSVVEDLLCIIVTSGSNAPYAFFPIGKGDGHNSLRKSISYMQDFFKSQNWQFIIRRAPNAAITFFQEDDSFNTKIELDRDNSDYVYLISDLTNLEGKRYDGKRNHISKFKRKYPEFDYHVLDESLIEACIDVEERWCRTKRCKEYLGLLNEKEAIFESLNHFGTLDYTGGVIRVNDIIEAFTFGEPMTDNMVVCHIEKADNAIDGLYTLVNQQFCQNTWSHMKYMNREQDMGIPGLRKAKESYQPVMMVDKYTIHFN